MSYSALFTIRTLKEKVSATSSTTRFVLPFEQWRGTVVGFRYPDHSTGQTIPGLHLHGLGANLLSGGHVRNITVKEVTAELWVDELHITGSEDVPDAAGQVDFDRYEGPVSERS
jgi:Alpha-acetolactate decarboxylase